MLDSNLEVSTNWVFGFSKAELEWIRMPESKVFTNTSFKRAFMQLKLSTAGFPATIILIFGVFAAAIGIMGYRYYQSQKDQIIREKYQELSAIADLKVEQIVKWRAERLGDDLRFLENSAFAVSVERFLSDPCSPAARAVVVRWLSPIIGNHCYHSVAIFDPDGRENRRGEYPGAGAAKGMVYGGYGGFSYSLGRSDRGARLAEFQRQAL